MSIKTVRIRTGIHQSKNQKLMALDRPQKTVFLTLCEIHLKQRQNNWTKKERGRSRFICSIESVASLIVRDSKNSSLKDFFQ